MILLLTYNISKYKFVCYRYRPFFLYYSQLQFEPFEHLKIGKMKESTKGVLLSALVYPGLGQLALGSKLSGALFAVLTTAGLLVVIYRLTIRIYHALDPILLSLADNTLNWSKLIEIVNLSSYHNWGVEGISLVFLLSCWAAAGVHAYLAGQKIDRLAA